MWDLQTIIRMNREAPAHSFLTLCRGDEELHAVVPRSGSKGSMSDAEQELLQLAQRRYGGMAGLQIVPRLIPCL